VAVRILSPGSRLKKITFHEIGVIHSPFKEPRGKPIQPRGAKGTKGIIKIIPKYVGGLKDLQGFSHIILLYQFHLSRGFSLTVTPFLDTHSHGVFATRAPRRPTPIGISVVRLQKIKGHKLYIQNLDIVDGTPILDIKPYVPEFDVHRVTRTGWLTTKKRNASKLRSDDRFM
jgi:tRNA-Thr(GGU) m(6)t(6)A37 methyltransferase TsaA